jgi:hypothetical protein
MKFYTVEVYKWATQASDFWISEGKTMYRGEDKAVSVNIKTAVGVSAQFRTPAILPPIN